MEGATIESLLNAGMGFVLLISEFTHLKLFMLK
jgi:hypothetical protein